MKLNVEVVSRETIKPSSPTPPHLRSFNLSLLDQFTFHYYVPVILFYPHNGEDNELDYGRRSDILKASLSETLVHFYPLAGSISSSSNNSSQDISVGFLDAKINCNDKGVEFLDAHVDCDLSQLLSLAQAEELTQLFPSDLEANAPLAIQLNLFACGGIAITVYMSHKLADACSICTFINSWASIAHGDSIHDIVRPSFDSTSIFPSQEVSIHLPPSCTEPPKEKTVSRRFVFDASNIAALKAKIAHNKSNQKYPSRFEAVSALLWRTAMAVDEQKQLGATSRPSMMGSMVNLRTRMDPPLPAHSYGNLCLFATTKPVTTTRVVELHELVEQIRDAIKEIDGDYVKKVQVDDEFLKLIGSKIKKNELCSKGEMQLYSVSSWCRFPFYEADYGWGKPFWVTNCATFSYQNVSIMMDTRCGEGVEAWVSMSEEDMARFECEPELLAFTTKMD